MTQKSKSFNIESLLSNDFVTSQREYENPWGQRCYPQQAMGMPFPPYVFQAGTHPSFPYPHPCNPWVNMRDYNRMGLPYRGVANRQVALGGPPGSLPTEWKSQVSGPQSNLRSSPTNVQSNLRSSPTNAQSQGDSPIFSKCDLPSTEDFKKTSPTGGQRGARRKRTTFTLGQLEQLEEAFKSDKYPSSNEREALSQILKVREDSIKVWFQNRRTKWKKEKYGSDSTEESGETKRPDNKPSFARLQELASSSNCK